MQAEELVTKLETSLALKNTGVPQGESYFVWVTGRDGSIRVKSGKIRTSEPDSEVVGWLATRDEFLERDDHFCDLVQIICAAFTFTELLKIAVEIEEKIPWRNFLVTSDNLEKHIESLAKWIIAQYELQKNSP